MKISLPFQFQLKINRQYKSVKKLMPIGCDCFPAYMLSKLELRKESLPFDWLDTKSHLALNFAAETIQSNFDFFLINLAKNDDEKVFSQKHPEALFYHFDDLIENFDLQKKIKERSNNFLEIYQKQPCYFVHVITSLSLEQKENLDFIIESVFSFITLLKNNDELLICLRFDESLDENSKHAQILENVVKTYSQVKIVSFVRQKNKFGIWGDETKYKQLIKNLGIQTAERFPKISIVKKI
jgi:hypothetical protein